MLVRSADVVVHAVQSKNKICCNTRIQRTPNTPAIIHYECQLVKVTKDRRKKQAANSEGTEDEA